MIAASLVLAGAGRRYHRHDLGPDRGQPAGAAIAEDQAEGGREAAGPEGQGQRDPALDLPGPGRRRAAISRACPSPLAWRSGWTWRRPRWWGTRPTTRSAWRGCRLTLGKAQLGLGYRREGDRPVHQGPRHVHGPSRSRPPRYPQEHDLARLGLPGLRQARPCRCRCSRRR